jgi:hypothetical protein
MWAIPYCSQRQLCWRASARTDRESQGLEVIQIGKPSIAKIRQFRSPNHEPLHLVHSRRIDISRASSWSSDDRTTRHKASHLVSGLQRSGLSGRELKGFPASRSTRRLITPPFKHLSMLVYGALSSHRQTDPAKFTMPLIAPRLIYSTATVRGWWLPRWVPSQPLAEIRAATSDLLTMLSNGALTPPAIERYPLNDFQEAVRLADGEAGQQKVLLDFSETAP